MNLKNIFIPNKAIKELPENKVKISLFFLTLFLSFFPLIFAEFFGQGLSGIIKQTFMQAGWTFPIQSSEQWIMLLNLIKSLLFLAITFFVLYAVITIIINWLVKKILVLFKKQITLFKLINISLYSFFYNSFINLLLSVLGIILIISGILNSNFKNYLSENYFVILFISLLGLIINLLPLIIYIYGIKISIKKYDRTK